MRGEACEVIIYSHFVSAVMSLILHDEFVFMVRRSIFWRGWSFSHGIELAFMEMSELYFLGIICLHVSW